MTTTEPVTNWPTCGTCQQAYTVTIGLPVVITGQGRYVDADVDVSDADDLDDSATITCGCGPLHVHSEADVERIRAALGALASAHPVLATYNLADQR